MHEDSPGWGLAPEAAWQLGGNIDPECMALMPEQGRRYRQPDTVPMADLSKSEAIESWRLLHPARTFQSLTGGLAEGKWLPQGCSGIDLSD